MEVGTLTTLWLHKLKRYRIAKTISKSRQGRKLAFIEEHLRSDRADETSIGYQPLGRFFFLKGVLLREAGLAVDLAPELPIRAMRGPDEAEAVAFCATSEVLDGTARELVF